MAITKKPVRTVRSADAFINAAPDAPQEDASAVTPQEASAPAVAAKSIRKIGHKNIISVSIEPKLVSLADAWAERHGLKRSQAIAYALRNLPGADDLVCANG